MSPHPHFEKKVTLRHDERRVTWTQLPRSAGAGGGGGGGGGGGAGHVAIASTTDPSGQVCVAGASGGGGGSDGAGGGGGAAWPKLYCAVRSMLCEVHRLLSSKVSVPVAHS